MATVNYAVQDMMCDNYLFTWTPLTTTNADGQAAAYVGSGDRTIQVTGTFGAGGTVIVEGSLDTTFPPTNWFPLKDPSNTAISFTAAGLRAILENVVAVRARVTAGDGTTSITATLAVRRQRNG
jgi:hypothetical protein